MNYRNIQLPSSRILEWGKQGENKATQLSVDVSEFIKLSEGTIAVSCCRPDGKKYPHDCTINDTTVEIELSSYDTQVCGILTIVVSWMCGERIVKSETYCGEISRSISTSGEKPTPPFDGLIEQVCNAAIKAKESADRAEAAEEAVYAPAASVTRVEGGAMVTVTDKHGTTSAVIRDGERGETGQQGEPGPAGVDGKDAVIDATLTQSGQAADAAKTGEAIDQLKGDLAQLQKENGVNNEQINGEISDIKISYEGEVGNVYNSGYVIKVSGNTAYKRAIIDISSFNEGTLTFIYDGTACFLSNTPTVDGSNNFIINLYEGNRLSIWEKHYGLYVSGNVATLDIKTLKQVKSEAKGMFVCCEVANWVDPYITYKGSTKSLKWLMISEDNLDSEFKKKISQIEINKNTIEELQKQSPSTVSEPIVFFGDSLTHGATTSYNDSYPKQFSDLSGLEIKNFGVGGEDVPTIMGRQGSQPFIVQPFTIPSDTSAVEVEIVGNQGFTVAPLKVSPNADKGLNPCYINGIEGTLTRDTASGMYYFARTTSGTEVEVNRPTTIITNASVNFRDNPTVIWMGQNGGYNSDDTMLVDDFVVALNYCKSKKVLIMAPFDGYGSSRANIEKLLTQRFGRKFINVRDYLVKYGLSDLNITPTDEDNADLENDRVPNSLRTDATHLTTEAYGIVARLVYERGQELGYWD